MAGRKPKVHCAAALAFSWQKSKIIYSNDLPGIIFQPLPFCTHWVSRHNIS